MKLKLMTFVEVKTNKKLQFNFSTPWRERFLWALWSFSTISFVRKMVEEAVSCMQTVETSDSPYHVEKWWQKKQQEKLHFLSNVQECKIQFNLFEHLRDLAEKNLAFPARTFFTLSALTENWKKLFTERDKN